MGGGLIQLIAIGEQDQFLTGNPQITFFKSVYKRHSNFSMEVRPQIFSGGVSFGSKNSCTISKDGDLISDISLHIKLDSLNISNANNICIKDLNMNCPCSKCNENNIFSWVNSIGHAIIEYVELEIGGYLIDKQYGEWFEIWSELTLNYEKKHGYTIICEPFDNEIIHTGNIKNKSLDEYYKICSDDIWKSIQVPDNANKVQFIKGDKLFSTLSIREKHQAQLKEGATESDMQEFPV